MRSTPSRLRLAESSLDEALTAQFYAWEKLGRGWQVWDAPVSLEPPFQPFLGHYVMLQPVADDARQPTFFGLIAEALRGEGSRPAAVEEAITEDLNEEPEPFEYEAPLLEIQIALPPDLKVSRERAAQLLCRLASARNPVTFELVGSEGSVSLQFVCTETDRPLVCQEIEAYCPEAVLREQSGFLAGQWRRASSQAVLVDYGLSHEFMLPLRVCRNFDVDPLIALVAALGQTRTDECGALQIIFTATKNPWPESIMRAVTNDDGRSFFADFPEIVPAAQQKTSEPLLAAVVRVASRAPTEARVWEISRNVGNALGQFSDPAGNEFLPLANDGYPNADHAADFLARLSRRSGVLLNAGEVASLVHLPSA
jgi:hypothetical protein